MWRKEVVTLIVVLARREGSYSGCRRRILEEETAGKRGLT
jgi:hypothetical protein